MDLDGTWRVAAATERRRRTFHELDHDDSGWATMRVPSHWAQAGSGTEGEGADLAGEESVLYRHRFEGPEEAAGTLGAADGSGRRWWLRIEGLAQQGDIWLDGSYLGHTDGYFVPHELEVTEQLAVRSEHLLAVDATCRRFGDPDNRTLLTGALQDPELCGVDDLIVGGVWRPVRLRSSGLVAMRHARAVCAEVGTPDGRGRGRGDGRPSARLELRAVLDVPGGGPVQLRTRVAGTEHAHYHHAADGENRVEWNVDVADPPLWWPHALGEQRLCDLTVEAVVDGDVHDRRRFRIGFRSVEMRRWVLHVNGERLFLKGANLLPTQRLLGAASPSEVASDVRAARKAGLDMIRPLAHIARPELYDTADELGVLIWQDLPIRGVMSRSVVGEARRQAREAVDLLGHHPSVAVWCAHDDPFPRAKRPSATPPAVSRLGPSWNRDVLDRRLGRVLSRCDGSRPVVHHTAVPPHFPSLEGTTSQLWFGLHSGRAADLAPTLARMPTMGQFVSAFGTPVSADQSEVVKTTIEILRRLKYRPTGGFLLHALADVGAGPGAGRSTSGRSEPGAGPAAGRSTSGRSEPGAGPGTGRNTSGRSEPGAGPAAGRSTSGRSEPGAGPAAGRNTSGRSEPGAGPAAGRNTSGRSEPGAGPAAGRNTSGRSEPGAGPGTGRNTAGPGAGRSTSGRSEPGAGPAAGAGGPAEPGGFGLLDCLRRPKPGWQALVDACRPLIAVADPLPASVRGGDRLNPAVHVINDTRADVDGIQVRARVLGPGDIVLSDQRWAGAVAADDCVLVGRIDAPVPLGTPPGPLKVELSLTDGSASDGTPAVVATNRYTTAIL